MEKIEAILGNKPILEVKFFVIIWGIVRLTPVFQLVYGRPPLDRSSRL
jgi:hypothetical protein